MVDWRRALLACFVVAMIGLSGCGGAIYYACLSCEEGIEETDVVEDVNVEASDLQIEVMDDGDTRWHVHSTLRGTGVERLSGNRTLISRLSEFAVTERVGRVKTSVHRGAVTNLSARLNGTTLRMTFTVDDFAIVDQGPIILVDGFHTEGGHPRDFNVGTDRIVLTTDADTVVTFSGENGTVSSDESRLIWTREDQYVSDQTYFAFAPSSGLKHSLLTHVALARQYANWVLPKASFLAVVQLLIGLPILLGLTLRNIGRIPIGAVGTGDTFVGRFLTSSPLDYVVIGLGLCSAFVAILANIRPLVRVIDTLLSTVPLIPVSLMLLIGYTADRRPRLERASFLVLLGLPLLATTASYVQPNGDAVLRVLWAGIVLIFVGIPGFLFGIRRNPAYVSSNTSKES